MALTHRRGPGDLGLPGLGGPFIGLRGTSGDGVPATHGSAPDAIGNGGSRIVGEAITSAGGSIFESVVQGPDSPAVVRGASLMMAPRVQNDEPGAAWRALASGTAVFAQTEPAAAIPMPAADLFLLGGPDAIGLLRRRRR